MQQNPPAYTLHGRQNSRPDANLKMSSSAKRRQEVSCRKTPAGRALMPHLKGETLAPSQICLFRFSRNGATRRRSTEGYGRDELHCFFI